MRSVLIEGDVLTAISEEQAISLIGRGWSAPSVSDIVATGGRFLGIKVSSVQGSQPVMGQWPGANPKQQGRQTDCPCVGLTCPGPQEETPGLTFPCPSPSALSLYCRVAGLGAGAPGALNCLACISQPLWGQLFLSLLWGLFADPSPPPLLSPSPSQSLCKIAFEKIHFLLN